MIYTLRAVLVSCSVFFLVYIAASVAIGCLYKPNLFARWFQEGSRSARFWKIVAEPRSDWRGANLIYGIRVSPLFLASAAVAVFTVPAFLRFEPLVSGESV